MHVLVHARARAATHLATAGPSLASICCVVIPASSHTPASSAADTALTYGHIWNRRRRRQKLRQKHQHGYVHCYGHGHERKYGHARTYEHEYCHTCISMCIRIEVRLGER
eukprot:6180507-Pleurochrysis_carterae.AAC.2